jgi:DNA-binding NarL/FixJ family response regulator
MMNVLERRTAVLLDPYPLVLDAVEELLEENGVDVVGKTTSSDQALDLAVREDADLLVTEIDLGGDARDGLACVREATERVRELKPIVFALSDDPRRIEAAFEAGAAAYVVKTAHPDDLASAIRQAFDGSVYLSNSAQPAPASEPPPDLCGLTPREIEILRVVADGSSNAEVARALWVTEQTVKFHLSNIFRKLKVSNRTEASRWAQLHGLLAPADTDRP